MWDVLDPSKPVGYVVLGLVIIAVAAIGSAVSKGWRKWFRNIFKYLGTVRLTTTTKIASHHRAEVVATQTRAVKPRFVLGSMKDAPKNEYVLINRAEGTVAFSVRLDSQDGGFQFDSAADWPSVHGLERATFSGKFVTYVPMGPTFLVSWYDAAGQYDSATISVRS